MGMRALLALVSVMMAGSSAAPQARPSPAPHLGPQLGPQLGIEEGRSSYREGAVDWERRVVRCRGTGAPGLREAAGVVSVTRVGTEDAARRRASRSCLAALMGLSVETGRTAAQALAGDPGLTSSLEEAVRRARSAGERRFFSDGGVELRLEVPLDGAVSELLLGALSSGRPAREGQSRPPTGVTGVLVDASGLSLEHALAPRILDEAGGEVYGPSMLTARARREGTAAYAVGVAAAKQGLAARLGAAPRLVRALRAEGADVVVSGAEADAIRGSACLAEGRVVIVARSRK
jgi:hypothetical protein